jgi:acyl-coenzyme A synthetase/AMP-(fatty) acid ligase
MKMQQSDHSSLWDALSAADPECQRFLRGFAASVDMAELVRCSILGGRRDELRGRSILLTTSDQLAAALALIELDGIVPRLVLCPPDLPADYIPFVAATAAVNAVVSDRERSEPWAVGVESFITCSPAIVPATPRGRGHQQTEWILLTSGTTGRPKLVVHNLSSLMAPIKPGSAARNTIVWGTFYDIRRYGGLQIFLRAVVGGGSMVLSSANESTGDFLTRAGACGVTHISGTPSHWRRALMSPSASRIAPRYVRMSGEIVDQTILDRLRAAFPEASVAHAFASTEAGVAFEVDDGLSGFPSELIGRANSEVAMKVENGSLRIRSARTASGYLSSETKSFADSDWFVDTGDLVELQGSRYYFIGRGDGIINVGGRKVHPEEVEAVINRHPSIQMSLVTARKNPITGAVVVADVVVKSEFRTGDDVFARTALQREILGACHDALPPHKVPAIIRFVPSLSVTGSGKLARFHA